MIMTVLNVFATKDENKSCNLRIKSRYLCRHTGRHGSVRSSKRGGARKLAFEGTTRRRVLKGHGYVQ